MHGCTALSPEVRIRVRSRPYGFRRRRESMGFRKDSPRQARQPIADADVRHFPGIRRLEVLVQAPPTGLAIRVVASRAGMSGTMPAARAVSLTRLTMPSSYVERPSPIRALIAATVAAAMPRAPRAGKRVMPAPSLPMPASLTPINS